MESGSTVYTAVEPSDVQAQDLGDTVVLTGSCRISVMSQGRPNSFSVRFTDVYAKQRRPVADGGLAIHPPAGVGRPSEGLKAASGALGLLNEFAPARLHAI